MGKKNNFSMKVAIIALLVAYVASQAMVEKACPKKLLNPKRVLQSVEHPASPQCTNFSASRLLQAVVAPSSPKVRVRIHVKPKATVFVPLRAGCYQKFPRLWCGSGFSTVRPKPYNNMTVNCCPSRRRQQAVQTKKCPVNIEGIQCFLNNTGKACEK